MDRGFFYRITRYSVPHQTLLQNSTTRLLIRRPIHPKIRTLHTTRPSKQPTATKYPTAQHAPSRPDLLSRVANRPLPTLASLSSTRRWLTTIPLFVAVIWASAAGIFNYQKVNSPIISATLYSLRTNPRVREVLGDEVYFASKWAWVWGQINLVQGRVDITFAVRGTKRKGMCRFRAKREGGRNGAFKTNEWSLTMEDGTVVQLLEGPDGPKDGPLGEALF